MNIRSVNFTFKQRVNNILFLCVLFGLFTSSILLYNSHQEKTLEVDQKLEIIL